MEKNPRFRRDLSDIVYWLKDSGFIIGHHQRNQFCVRTQCPTHIVGVDETASIDWKHSHVAAHLVQMHAGMEHSMMLDARRDHMIASRHPSGNGQIVAFRATAGK